MTIGWFSSVDVDQLFHDMSILLLYLFEFLVLFVLSGFLILGFGWFESLVGGYIGLGIG